MLLEPPKFLNTFPYVTFNPFGTSIFLTMPALLLAFLGFRHRNRRWLATALLSACILPVLLLLMYFNTGWYQFGYRFVLDFLPFLLLLAALGMKERPTLPAKLLIALSVLINVWGYIVFAYFKPPLFG
jgi:peptidoglycan/LPS O-acetylase OafA/YrhL